jgi:hypothetical protein
LERQRSYGSLMGLARVALLLGVDLRPEGMPARLRRPFDARLPEELGTLAAPVHPGLLAAAFGDGRDPGIFLPFCSGSRPCALFAKGDEEAGSANGPRPGERLAEGQVGMALGTRRDGGVEIGSGLALDVHVPSDDLFVDRGEPVLLVNLESPQGVSHGGRLGRRGSRAGGGLG